MKTLSPRLETLPPSQRNLWPDLGPIAKDFVLYGGTALSLQVGGRQSVDFDFFTSSPVNPEDITERFPFLRKATLIQRAESTASFALNCPEPVKLSFFGTLDFGRVDEPLMFSDNKLVAAGPLDLAAQKVRVVQVRAEAKDYIDICTLINHGVPLAKALGAAQTIYPNFNPIISLKALTFFNDGDLRTLTKAQRDQLIAAVSAIRDIPVVPKLSESLLPTQRPLDIEDTAIESYCEKACRDIMDGKKHEILDPKCPKRPWVKKFAEAGHPSAIELQKIIDQNPPSGSGGSFDKDGPPLPDLG